MLQIRRHRFPAKNTGEFHMAQRDAVFPAGRHDLYTSQTYSAAIRSDDLLFVSGHVGSHSDGSPEPNFEAQVRLAFANLEATLRAGGCGLDDIVDVTTFHTDPENQFGTIMTVKSEVFPEAPYPNWTAIGVNWLAGSTSRSRSSPVFPAELNCDFRFWP
jgi:enamine deaminase RidA (YjgF/YER057c/UK114 family)